MLSVDVSACRGDRAGKDVFDGLMYQLELIAAARVESIAIFFWGASDQVPISLYAQAIANWKGMIEDADTRLPI